MRLCGVEPGNEAMWSGAWERAYVEWSLGMSLCGGKLAIKSQSRLKAWKRFYNSNNY